MYSLYTFRCFPEIFTTCLNHFYDPFPVAQMHYSPARFLSKRLASELGLRTMLFPGWKVECSQDGVEWWWMGTVPSGCAFPIPPRAAESRSSDPRAEADTRLCGLGRSRSPSAVGLGRCVSVFRALRARLRAGGHGGSVRARRWEIRIEECAPPRFQGHLLMVGARSVESTAAQRGGELPIDAEYVQGPGGHPEALLRSLLWGCFSVLQRRPRRASGCRSPP